MSNHSLLYTAIFIGLALPAILCATPIKIGEVDNHVRWDADERAFVFQDIQLKIEADVECGYFDNRAEYSSLGLERQLFKCSKIIFPVTLSYHKISGVVEFSPLYDSIKVETPTQIVSIGRDLQGRSILGSNPYFDWYKNLGTRVYYLGSVPLVEAFVAFEFYQYHKLSIGRIKKQSGLLDKDTPWNDDGMFSPYAHWLSRDLLTGISYDFLSHYLTAHASFSSGNNPYKGYSNYLNYIQTPNLKANNTPNLGLDVALHIGHLHHPQNRSKLIFSVLYNIQNSTWFNVNNDGKRRNSIIAAAILINIPIVHDASIDLFGQWTRYFSGLMTDSHQFNANVPVGPSNLFRNITQDGFYVGMTLNYWGASISYTYEYFDRFDFNVYRNFVLNNALFFGASLSQLQHMHQQSHIINVAYQFNRNLALIVHYHHVRNPLQWVSSINNRHSDDRLNLGVRVTV